MFDHVHYDLYVQNFVLMDENVLETHHSFQFVGKLPGNDLGTCEDIEAFFAFLGKTELHFLYHVIGEIYFAFPSSVTVQILPY
jgi:hypothetical protein